MAVVLLAAVAAVLALQQTAGVKLLEEAGLVHLVEGHLEPYGLVAVAVVVELQGPF